MEIKQAVHLPEFALRCGRFGGFGCTQGPGMTFHEWEMSMDQTQAVNQFTSQLLGGPMSLLTASTLVVAIIDHCNGRVGWAHHVVALVHRHRQRNSLCFNHV